MGLPWWLSGKEHACQCRRHKRWGFNPGLGRPPGGGHGNPLQYSYLKNPHGQRNLVGYSPKGQKELDTTGSNWASKPNLGRCCLLTKLCLTLCDPMDCSSPDSSVRGISQVRILEWVAIFLSNGTSDPGIELLSLALAGRFFTTHWATREAPVSWDIASQIALRNWSKEKVGKG